LPFVGKITGHFLPIFPLSLLEVCRVVVGVGAPGGAKGDFQSRDCTISLHGYSTSEGTSTLDELSLVVEEPFDGNSTVVPSVTGIGLQIYFKIF
jgi:hypothetical protein